MVKYKVCGLKLTCFRYSEPHLRYVLATFICQWFYVFTRFPRSTSIISTSFDFWLITDIELYCTYNLVQPYPIPTWTLMRPPGDCRQLCDADRQYRLDFFFSTSPGALSVLMHPSLRFVFHRWVILALLHRPIHLRFIKYVLKVIYDIVRLLKNLVR